MEADEQHKAYYEGYNAGKNEHSKPSRDTLERFNLLEIAQARMEQKIQSGFENINDKVDVLSEMIKNHIEQEEKLHQSLDDKKADVWVESFAKGMMAIVGTSFLSLLAYLGVKIFEAIYK